MLAADTAGQHFLYANLSQAQSKQDVLEQIATASVSYTHLTLPTNREV